jgi:hypothetical protein
MILRCLYLFNTYVQGVFSPIQKKQVIDNKTGEIEAFPYFTQPVLSVSCF